MAAAVLEKPKEAAASPSERSPAALLSECSDRLQVFHLVVSQFRSPQESPGEDLSAWIVTCLRANDLESFLVRMTCPLPLEPEVVLQVVTHQLPLEVVKKEAAV